MQASPARGSRPYALMADAVVLAEPAAEEQRVFADATRRLVVENDALAPSDLAQAIFRVVLNALGISGVVILVDDKVQGAAEPERMHADLHLSIVQRLGSLAALAGYILEPGVVRRLELAQVLCLRRFGHADSLAVALAADESMRQANSILLPPNRHADALQVVDEDFFPTVARAEDGQLAPLDRLRLAGPPQRIVERAVALVADLADADAEAVVLPVRRLVGGIDGPDRAGLGARKGRH